MPWLLSTGGVNGALILPLAGEEPHLVAADRRIEAAGDVLAGEELEQRLADRRRRPRIRGCRSRRPSRSPSPRARGRPLAASWRRRIAPARLAGPPPTKRTSTSRESRSAIRPVSLRRRSRRSASTTATRCIAIRSSGGRARGVSKVSAHGAARRTSTSPSGSAPPKNGASRVASTTTAPSDRASAPPRSPAARARTPASDLLQREAGRARPPP